MEIVILGNGNGSGADRVLRQKAVPVKDINGEVRLLVEGMIETMHAGRGVGLAAPQVGQLKRLFVTRAEGDETRVFINPSIIWTSQEEVNYEEGCLSLPGIWAEIKRPGSVRIQAWNEKGRAFTLEASGTLARVIQHEYDHLEGLLFIDRVNEVRREKLLTKLKVRQKKLRRLTR